MSHHHFREFFFVGFSRLDSTDVFALSENGDNVGYRHYLVQLVGDEDDGLAVLLHGLQHVEELLGLLRRKHRRRLVQDKDIRSPVEDLDDLYGHLVDLLIRIYLETVFLSDLLYPGGDDLPVQLAFFLQSQNDILSSRKHVHQFEVLMDHSYLVVEGIFGGFDGYRLAVDQDLSLIGEIYPGQHIHECGLAGTVLSQKRHDHAAIQIKIHRIIGNVGSESLGYPSEFHCMCGF